MSTIEIGDEVRRLYGRELPGATTPRERRWERRRSVLITTAVITVTAVFFAGVYYFNNFAILQQDCYAQQALIEKEFQRRADLIPQLIAVSKVYATHEQALMKYVADTHSLIQSAKKLPPSAALGKSSFETALAGLMAVAEQYPDLKATQSFQDLMEKLETTEDRIASMRDLYVDKVRRYNTLQVTFPSSVFNGLFRYESIEYYRALDSSVPAFTPKAIDAGGRIR